MDPAVGIYCLKNPASGLVVNAGLSLIHIRNWLLLAVLLPARYRCPIPKCSRLDDVLHIRAQGQAVRVGVGQRWQRDARGHDHQQARGQTVSRVTTCRWHAGPSRNRDWQIKNEARDLRWQDARGGAEIENCRAV